MQAILTTSSNQDLLAFKVAREIQQTQNVDSFSIRQKRSPKKSSDEEEVSFLGAFTIFSAIESRLVQNSQVKFFKNRFLVACAWFDNEIQA